MMARLWSSAAAPRLALRVVEPASTRPVWSVVALVQAVADALASRFAVVAVRGELSAFARAASGHCYFSLKDADGGSALIRCAMFRRAASLLDFTPADGQLVELRGRLAVYEPRGELQFVVESMQRAGSGALYEQFLRLKSRLEAEGLFDASRKRALPAFPATIGVVTSLGAAALHDVVTALARRAPHVRVVLYPSLVQGADAPPALVRAIANAAQRAEVDVLIVCRGGGSLEDLWAFNDERVVRAIAAFPMPVVSGVGHETDVTLADFAADLRAPTPTAAAELVSPAAAECLQRLQAIAHVMQRRMHHALDAGAQRLDAASLRLSRPAQSLGVHRLRLATLAARLRTAAARQAPEHLRTLERLGERSARALSGALSREQQRLASADARLRALDPARVLQRGYAWLADAEGRAIVSARQLSAGQRLDAVLADGRAAVDVVTVKRTRRRAG